MGIVGDGTEVYEECALQDSLKFYKAPLSQSSAPVARVDNRKVEVIHPKMVFDTA